jgi:hypothetical protein
MDIVGLTNLLSNIGALGVSALIIWALLRGWVVTKGRLDEMRDQRDLLQHELDVERARHEREH